MLIGCLQYSPKLGKVDENIARANTLLKPYSSGHFDLLVLPELAFTGYNFLSRDAIEPYLELTSLGPTTQWAKQTAARLKCIVSVGYPERAILTAGASPVCYNSTVTVSPNEEVLAHYRKTHLYYTDETWAAESPDGFLVKNLPLPSSFPQSRQGSTGSITTADEETPVAFGICMDINPYQFTAPPSEYEFSSHAFRSQAKLVLLSMAWLTDLTLYALEDKDERPDFSTLAYWISRLKPLRQANRDVTVVIANRMGIEEPDARYAGTSLVARIQRNKTNIIAVMGRYEEGVLEVDTESEAQFTMEELLEELREDDEYKFSRK